MAAGILSNSGLEKRFKYRLNVYKTVRVELTAANAGSVLDILAKCGAMSSPGNEIKH